MNKTIADRQDLIFNINKNYQDKKSGNRYIEGFVALAGPDRSNIHLTDGALESAVEDLKNNTTAFIDHDWKHAIGRVDDVEIKYNDKVGYNGIWVKVYISETEDVIFRKVQEKILNKFSIGFSILEYEKVGHGDDVVYLVHKAEFYDVSIAGLPANSNAEIMDFYVEKSLAKAIKLQEEKKMKEVRKAMEVITKEGVEESVLKTLSSASLVLNAADYIDYVAYVLDYQEKDGSRLYEMVETLKGIAKEELGEPEFRQEKTVVEGDTVTKTEPVEDEVIPEPATEEPATEEKTQEESEPETVEEPVVEEPKAEEKTEEVVEEPVENSEEEVINKEEPVVEEEVSDEPVVKTEESEKTEPEEDPILKAINELKGSMLSEEKVKEIVMGVIETLPEPDNVRKGVIIDKEEDEAKHRVELKALIDSLKTEDKIKLILNNKKVK